MNTQQIIKNGFDNLESKVCQDCKRPFNNPDEKEFIELTGSCFTCDSIRADIMVDAKYETINQ